MELVLIVLVWTVVVKRGVEDLIHAARGNTPHRYAAARTRRSSGAAGRYWRTLRDDTFDDLLKRHTERRDRRAAGQSSGAARPRGAATQYFAGVFQDWRRAARRSWDAGWVRADEKRREKRTRPRPGQVTVPGTVVPNRDETQDERRDGGQDETQDRPRDEDGTDPRTVPTPDGGTDLQFGDDPTDPTGVRSCPECDGTGINKDGGICESCRDRQEQRNQHHDNQEDHIDGERDAWRVRYPNGETAITNDGEFYENRPGYATVKVRGHDEAMGFRVTHEYPDVPPTQEGTTTMTATTTEIMGLDSAIQFCDQVEQQFTTQVSQHDANSAKTAQVASAYRSLAVVIDNASAAIANGGVTGETSAQLANAQEQANAAAADMDAATLLFTSAQEKAGLAAQAMEAACRELQGHKGVQEQYNANPGAGTREFVTAGQ
jgi:hypothetical protein